jgi:hypothetical protein
MPRQILILDSSQIDTWETCKMSWKLSYDENLRHLGEFEREDIEMGTYGHKLMEIYYTNRALGFPIDKCVTECEQFHESCNKVEDFWLNPEGREKVFDRFDLYWKAYSRADISPALGKPVHEIVIDPFDNVNDVFSPNPLVEKGFSYELLNTPDYLFVLEGRVDLIGDLNGITVFMDHKFQGRRRALYTKSIQFRNYSMALNLSLGVINYVRLAKEIDSKETFKRELISFPLWEREWWRKELIKIFHRIASSKKEEDFGKNFSACSGKFGYQCQFTKICEEHNLVTIQAVKDQHYKKKEVWKPW